MRIATLTFCGPFAVASPSNPDSLFRNRCSKIARSATSRTAVLGLVITLLGACQPGSGTESVTAAAADAADSATDTVVAAADATMTDSDSKKDANPMLDSDAQKASYAMGFGLTSQATSQFGDAIDHDAFVAGVRAQLVGGASEVAQADAQRALTALNDAQKAKQALVASANAKAGAKFLADNATKEGVVTTASGLQYLVLQEGQGPTPAATDTVKTHYQGTLIDGKIFDGSIGGDPVSFALNRVIPGWTEALQLMNAGSKYRLFIPPELAYGNNSQREIPAQSTLIFEVELIEILGADAS